MERDCGTARSSFWSLPLVRSALFWLGVLLIILSPLVGVIPGPGGIVVFALGAGLMLKNSRWAKKQFIRFRRKHPKKGAFIEKGLRRPTWKRRQERLQAIAAGQDGQAAEVVVVSEYASVSQAVTIAKGPRPDR